MDFSREQIYSQLFNLLQTQCAATNPDAAAIAAVGLTPLPKVASPAFVFGTRRPVVLGTLEFTQYPALMLLEKGEIFDNEVTYGPPKVTLIAHVVIQTAVGQDPNSIPATEANNLADVVQEIIETGAGQFGPAANRLVLNLPNGEPGGLVFVCRVSGREVLYLALQNQVYSQQDFEVELVGTH